MKNPKFSEEADKLACLYKAAFYLAKGHRKRALEFLKKSGVDFGFSSLGALKKEEELYWAEKILDEYIRRKRNFLS